MRNHQLSVLFLLLSVLVGIAHVAHAQAPAPASLTVVHVAGKVSLPGKQPLQLGQKFTDQDKLAFADKHGRLIAWQPKVGLLFLHPAESASDHGGGLQGSVQSFVDDKTTIAQGARLQRFTNTQQLKAHFEARKYLVLGKTWLIGPPQFQAKDDTVFLLKYRSLKENFQTGHPFTWANDTLRIDQASLLELNGRALDPQDISDYRLWWYNMKSRKFGEITYFQFVFADEAQVAAEIKMLLGLMKDNKLPEKRDAVRKLVGLAYGEPDAHNYAAWIAAHFPELK